MELVHVFVLPDGLAPGFGKGHRLVMNKVVEHHDGEAAAFHLLGIDVDDVLIELEALVADLHDTGAGGYMVAGLDLRDELRFNLHHDNRHAFPIDILADRGKVVRLGCVVELEIDRVVHVPELIYVVETNLYGQYVLRAALSL